MTSRSDLESLRLEVQHSGRNMRRMRCYWKRPSKRLLEAYRKHAELLGRYRAELETWLKENS